MNIETVFTNGREYFSETTRIFFLHCTIVLNCVYFFKNVMHIFFEWYDFFSKLDGLFMLYKYISRVRFWKHLNSFYKWHVYFLALPHILFWTSYECIIQSYCLFSGVDLIRVIVDACSVYTVTHHHLPDSTV